jgi:hypothetical protein
MILFTYTKAGKAGSFFSCNALSLDIFYRFLPVIAFWTSIYSEVHRCHLSICWYLLLLTRFRVTQVLTIHRCISNVRIKIIKGNNVKCYDFGLKYEKYVFLSSLKKTAYRLFTLKSFGFSWLPKFGSFYYRSIVLFRYHYKKRSSTEVV